MRTMPTQRPGRSKQNYGTPNDFLAACYRKLDIDGFDVDLAADRTNYVAPRWVSEKQNSLSLDWYALMVGALDWLWLNPPYAHIAPWVQKAWQESQQGARIAVLIPASTGSNYWRDYVHHKAHVLLLNGRITFVGQTNPYPKDCALLLYDQTRADHDYEVWSWGTDKETVCRD